MIRLSDHDALRAHTIDVNICTYMWTICGCGTEVQFSMCTSPWLKHKLISSASLISLSPLLCLQKKNRSEMWHISFSFNSYIFIHTTKPSLHPRPETLEVENFVAAKQVINSRLCHFIFESSNDLHSTLKNFNNLVNETHFAWSVFVMLHSNFYKKRL